MGKFEEIANEEVMERLLPLDEALGNVRAFRALMETFRKRDPYKFKDPHITTIQMVRASIVRSLVGTLCAVLDKKKDDRASIGQILHALNSSPDVVKAIQKERVKNPPDLTELTKKYAALLGTKEFTLVEKLRNSAIAHILITAGEIPPVEYDAIYMVADEAEAIATQLFNFCGYADPVFKSSRASLEKHAEIFWATYETGMAK